MKISWPSYILAGSEFSLPPQETDWEPQELKEWYEGV